MGAGPGVSTGGGLAAGTRSGGDAATGGDAVGAGAGAGVGAGVGAGAGAGAGVGVGTGAGAGVGAGDGAGVGVGTGAGRGEIGRCALAGAGESLEGADTVTGAETSAVEPCDAERTGTATTRGRDGLTTLGLAAGVETRGVAGSDRGGGAAICPICGWSTCPQR